MTGGYFVDRLRQRYGLKVLVAEGEHQHNVHVHGDRQGSPFGYQGGRIVTAAEAWD